MSKLIKLLDVYSEAKVANPDNACQLTHGSLNEFTCHFVQCKHCFLWFSGEGLDEKVNLTIAPILKELVNDYKNTDT